MSTRSRRGRTGQPALADADDEFPIPASAAGTRASMRDAENDELRQLAARRKLEQYLESKRLREHLQEIYHEEDC